MDYLEAATLAAKIGPKYAVPTHYGSLSANFLVLLVLYGSIVGNIEDGILFKNSLSKSIKCEILIKEEDINNETNYK